MEDTNGDLRENEAQSPLMDATGATNSLWSCAGLAALIDNLANVERGNVTLVVLAALA